MADMTTGTGADSPEDIRDEPALESVGVDPDAPIAQAADESDKDEEDDDEFDEDEADEDDDEDEETQQASDDDKE